MNADPESILGLLRGALPGVHISLRKNPGPSAQHSLLIEASGLVEASRFLRDHQEFDLLSNVTGIDWPDPTKADKVAPTEDEGAIAPEVGFLEVVYHLFSTTRRVGPLVLRCRTKDRREDVRIPSLVSVYRSAEFQEREIYDLFGVTFTGHPDLRRILMWDEYVDHPMRKDYVAPDDYEYEPTPHDAVLEKAKVHYPAPS